MIICHDDKKVPMMMNLLSRKMLLVGWLFLLDGNAVD